MNIELLVVQMKRWRRRDEEQDRGTWHGVSWIAGNLKTTRRAARKMLEAAHVAGLVERADVSNGTFWRGLLNGS